MNSATIESLLKSRGAWLKAVQGDAYKAAKRADLTRKIAADYVRFEELRDLVLKLTHANSTEETEQIFANQGLGHLLHAMEAHELISEGAHGRLHLNNQGRRYLSGGWLEELAWLAANAAGAHEAIFGQVVGWEVQGYSGENEIDLIFRNGKRLAFVSCKALRSELDITDRKHRNRLMDAVHAADNLADHFGQHGEKVAVVVSTDLYDEMKNVPRYQALMGKAAVLDVRIIALEDLVWERLVAAMEQLMK